MFLYSGGISAAVSAGKISIGGYSSSCISGGGYRLRVGSSLQRYDNEFGCNDFINLGDSPTLSESIGGSGYPLVPGFVYVIQARETSVSSAYDIMLASTEEAVRCGLQVLGTGMLISGSLKVAVSVVQPLIIHQNDYFAKLQFHKDCDHTMP